MCFIRDWVSQRHFNNFGSGEREANHSRPRVGRFQWLRRLTGLETAWPSGVICSASGGGSWERGRISAPSGRLSPLAATTARMRSVSRWYDASPQRPTISPARRPGGDMAGAQIFSRSPQCRGVLSRVTGLPAAEGAEPVADGIAAGNLLASLGDRTSALGGTAAVSLDLPKLKVVIERQPR
jgi:hypothetical protein